MPPSSSIPHSPRSLWAETAPAAPYRSLDGDHEVDVAIVGGGITGIVASATA